MDATLFFVLVAIVVAHLAYWIIRLAVRHGIQDVQKMASPNAGARSHDRPSDLTSTGESLDITGQ